MVVFPQPIFSSNVECSGKVVQLLRLVEILEHGALHVLAPASAPVGGAGLPHQPESGIGDDPLDHGRRDVAQLPPEVLPDLGRQGRLGNLQLKTVTQVLSRYTLEL